MIIFLNKTEAARFFIDFYALQIQGASSKQSGQQQKTFNSVHISARYANIIPSIRVGHS